MSHSSPKIKIRFKFSLTSGKVNLPRLHNELESFLSVVKKKPQKTPILKMSLEMFSCFSPNEYLSGAVDYLHFLYVFKL